VCFRFHAPINQANNGEGIWRNVYGGPLPGISSQERYFEKMIKGILVVNNHGKPRLIKFYEPIPFSNQQRAIKECYQLVSKRPDIVCNFLEGGSIWGHENKLIYRHYATLYFIFVVDESESELGILDLIQVFVETLDRCFENVCELDLIFHSDKVNYILDEIIMGGMVLETNKEEIMTAIEEQNKLEKESKKENTTITKIRR
jgi:AP-3 complex subunit sigma